MTLAGSPTTPVIATAFVLPFDSISAADVPLVGGKNASLGEMYRTVPGTRLCDAGEVARLLPDVVLHTLDSVPATS